MDGVRAPYQLIQCLNGLLLNRLLLAGAQVEISDDLWILCLQYYMFVENYEARIEIYAIKLIKKLYISSLEIRIKILKYRKVENTNVRY